MLEVYASLQGGNLDVGSTASQFILASRFKHAVLGVVLMWWS